MPKVKKLTQASQPDNDALSAVEKQEPEIEKVAPKVEPAEGSDAEAQEANRIAENKEPEEAKTNIEIGQGWDDAADGRDGIDRDADEEQVVGTGNVEVPTGASAQTEANDDAPPTSLKRQREEEPEQEQPVSTDYPAPGGQDYGNEYAPKRTRQECYRCGGNGHIAVMCISEYNAKTNQNLSFCHTCNGRGHMSRDCPNGIPSGVCFKCRREGHRGRECPFSGGGGGGAYGGPMQQNTFGGYGAAQGGYYDANNYSSYGGPPGGYDRPAYGGGDPYGRPAPKASVGSGRCFRCNEPGHWTRDCPYRPADGDPNGCYKCGKAGHRAKDCSMCFKCKTYGHNPLDCPATAIPAMY